ncbi:fimbria/pilus outer membrane usher protein, partial [Shigella flexneri]
SITTNRYASGYATLTEAVSAQDERNRKRDKNSHDGSTISLSQPLGNIGNLNFNTTRYNSSRGTGNTRSTRLSYSTV